MTKTTISWTAGEIRQFDRLVDDVSSQNQLLRIEARGDLKAFVETHGKPKCDAMFEHLKSGGKKEDFNLQNHEESPSP